MKINCPRCDRPMTTRFIGLYGNNTNIQFNGVKVNEVCPYSDCGFVFNPYKDGIYDSKDGVPILIKDLSGLQLNESSIKKLKRTNFEGINNEDVLLKKARYIDISLFEMVQKWIKNGISFLTILLALTTFSSKVNHNNDRLKTNHTYSISLPESAIRSFQKSTSRSSISKTRGVDDLNTDSLKRLNAGSPSKKDKNE